MHQTPIPIYVFSKVYKTGEAHLVLRIMENKLELSGRNSSIVLAD